MAPRAAAGTACGVWLGDVTVKRRHPPAHTRTHAHTHTRAHTVQVDKVDARARRRRAALWAQPDPPAAAAARCALRSRRVLRRQQVGAWCAQHTRRT
jgi:hypothetical protein